MNKAELVSNVAAETSTTRAAERMVGAVSSAIADGLSPDEQVAIAGIGKLAVRGRASRQGRNPPNREAGRRTGVEATVVKAGESPSRRRQRIA